ncbi:MAG: NAD-dependent epimerase/dehydratase family protein [Clostridia bacterium]|nr:NAD-dependent epimerase/dehydratase family protein [Clostridia bacterium]
MRILVTGADGFVGKNLCAELDNIASGKRRVSPIAEPVSVMRYDIGNGEEELSRFCAEADFVVNLAGVNRPKDPSEFSGNSDFASRLTALLREKGNCCPVLLSSSVQAELDNPYGASKRAAEDAVLEHARLTGAEAYVYRFPNLFGKWCRPNYNSVVATFCHNVAHGLPIRVDDGSKIMRLAYIDDVVDEIISCIAGKKQAVSGRCEVETVYERSLGFIAETITGFASERAERRIPEVSDPFIKKLYSTYLSYVPAEDIAADTVTHSDARGSFTELLDLKGAGQLSVNVCRPGQKKGDHWHHTKTEKFIVVSGRGVIRERCIAGGEAFEIPVSGDGIKVVDMLPGFTHSIENTGDEDLIFVIWANERFDPERPDTFYERV